MAFRKPSGGGLSPAARITSAIIERLEAGTKPWVKPWRGVKVTRPLRACGIPYQGMNVFWLWLVGKGAEALGLNGEVEARAFEQVLKGYLPDGTRLGTDQRAHRPGTDAIGERH